MDKLNDSFLADIRPATSLGLGAQAQGGINVDSPGLLEQQADL